MAELEFMAEVVLVEYVCDECGYGLMKRKGNIVLTSDPPKFPHECETCNRVQNLSTSYPTPRFKRIEEPK